MSTIDELDARKNVLLTEQIEVTDAAARIEADLRSAGATLAATGEYADAGWYRRASDAKRHRQRRLMEISAELSLINQERKKLNVGREMEKLREELNQILATASGQPMEKVTRDTDRDFYLNAQEAIDYGLADRIIDRL